MTSIPTTIKYFLASLSSDAVRFALLQNTPLLTLLELNCWQLPKDISHIPSHLFPFQVSGDDERTAQYESVVQAMKNGNLSRLVVEFTNTAADRGERQALMRL